MTGHSRPIKSNNRAWNDGSGVWVGGGSLGSIELFFFFFFQDFVRPDMTTRLADGNSYSSFLILVKAMDGMSAMVMGLV